MGTDKEIRETEEAKSSIERARDDLNAAKAEFMDALNNLQPVQFVREKPLICAGSAFLLGFGLTSLSRKLAWIELLPIFLQTAETASRLFVNLRKD